MSDIFTAELETLLAMRHGPIWDGNLPSKSARDCLARGGYIDRGSGFQWLSSKGIELLVSLRYLDEDTWRDTNAEIIKLRRDCREMDAWFIENYDCNWYGMRNFNDKPKERGE